MGPQLLARPLYRRPDGECSAVPSLASAQTSTSPFGGTTFFRFLMGPEFLKLHPLQKLDDLDEILGSRC